MANIPYFGKDDFRYGFQSIIATYTPSPIFKTDSGRDVTCDEGVDDEWQRCHTVYKASPLNRSDIGNDQTEN